MGSVTGHGVTMLNVWLNIWGAVESSLCEYSGMSKEQPASPGYKSEDHVGPPSDNLLFSWALLCLKCLFNEPLFNTDATRTHDRTLVERRSAVVHNVFGCEKSFPGCLWEKMLFCRAENCRPLRGHQRLQAEVEKQHTPVIEWLFHHSFDFQGSAGMNFYKKLNLQLQGKVELRHLCCLPV